MTAPEVVARRDATLAELEALPEMIKGEIIEGVLYTQARPAFRHSRAASKILADLDGPFDRGRRGPGGWWLVVEPGITLPGSPELSPDVAGWRRERLAEPPEGRVPIVPDWIGEVLSPSTRSYDLGTKRAFYARIGVAHLWYLDLEARTLTVSRLERRRWVELGIHVGSGSIRAEPFEAVKLKLGDWVLDPPALRPERGPKLSRKRTASRRR